MVSRLPFALALTTLLALARPARAGDPDRVWMTIETEHFVIHTYEPLGDVGRRLAVVAERAHRTLAPALGHEPWEKCQVVLVDDTDGANGFANVLPRNSVTIFATAPGGGSALNDHDDWLYGLFGHEYTHILHLDTITGLPFAYNKVFGKTWAPNQVMPRWVIEGIATYEESKRSAGGRTRNTSFDMFLRVPVLEGTELDLDQITGNPRLFPRGNAAYLYGSHFLRYVFDRYGDDALRRMSHASAERPLPFAVNRQIAEVIGRPFEDLYEDWRAHMRDKYALQAEAVDRRGRITGRQLTATSESNLAPAYSGDGKELYWFQSDGYRRGRVRAMPVGGDGKRARDVRQIESIGAWAVADDGSLVYEQSQTYRRDYSYQDLFHWDRRSDRVVRLTYGKRGRDPALSPDEREVAFSMNGESRSVLAVIPVAPDATPQELWRGPGRFDQVYQPAWSPDGRQLAFSAWRAGGLRDILVLDRASGAVTEVTRDRAIDGSPAWSHDGHYLYFESDRTGIANIFAWDVRERRLYQITNVIGGAFEPAVSPDGKRLAYHGFVGDGFDLFEVDVDPATWRPAELYVDTRPPPTEIRDDEVAVPAPRPYRPLETLAPQSWTGELSLSTLSRAFTLNTSGSDMAGLHGYTLGVAIDLDRGDLNVGASYGYSALRMPFRVAAARNVNRRGGYRIEDVNRQFTEEAYGATVSFGVPSERRPGASWNLSFDYDIDWTRMLDDPLMEPDPNDNVPMRPLTDTVQAGVALRASFGNAQGSTYSTGPNTGFDVSFSTRVDHPALGADNRALTVNWSGRIFTGVPWGKTPTLTARLAGGIRAGDLPRSGTFALGGVPSQDLVRAILDSTRAGSTGFLRGYPPRILDGNQFHLINAEYRHELYNIERGLSTLPGYFKRVHVAAMVDAGTAFDDENEASWDRVKVGLGAALRVDAFFGFFVPGTFELGYARGVMNGAINEVWLNLTGSL